MRQNAETRTQLFGVWATYRRSSRLAIGEIELRLLSGLVRLLGKRWSPKWMKFKSNFLSYVVAWNETLGPSAMGTID